ncbi:protein ELYS isoform X3 [Cherax quadricarinatus]
MVGVSVVQVGSAVRHIPLPPLTHETESALNSEDPTKDLGNNGFPVLGGFVGGGQLAWRAVGPTVEIIEPSTGTRKAAWTFGAILHNTGTRVTSVCGVGPGAVSQVVVGVDHGADRKPQGMVALLSLYSSRLTRVFHFTHKVTSLCMVSNGEVSVDSGTLAPELRPWHGLLVVGTAHGTLHLLDLALDLGGHKVLSDEVSPGSLISVVAPDPQAERSRISSVMQNCHPTMCLSDGMSYGGRFQLIGPDDNVLFETSGHLVSVTALSFIPQLASLVVGYNFGAFQIINLSTLTIDCASPYEANMPPVISFACQEPENDPKNFVYLWLCRSFRPTETSKENKIRKGNTSNALCTMYAMNYDSKVWIEGHGLWYQGLASISPRFEFDAIGGFGFKGQPTDPSVVFSAMTVRQTMPTSAAAHGGSSSVSALATPDEDSGPVPEQSLCLFGWVGGTLEEGHISLNHYLAVFDINQWYQAQMPSNLKLEKNSLCPYMSFHILDRVPGHSTNGGLSEIVLGAAPKPASWARHMSRTCNESDWFPAALSYDAHLLTSEGLMEYRCQSAQQAALTYLTSNGPSAIVSPEESYAMCVFAGLVSPDVHPTTTTGSSMVIEREALLNVALDQQLVSLLVQCVAEFSEGRFTNLGCSLPSLLEWSWSRVSAIKTANDSLSFPLFDPDGGVMSSESITALHQNLTSLASLTTIITTIRDYANTNMITLQGAGELDSRVKVVSLLMLHLSVLLWFYHCGLLSRSPLEDAIEECHVPFPAELLCGIYKNRRSEIQNLSSSLVGNEILMIDGLLEDTVGGSGGSIGKAWEKEGGSGMYPPPSLHAVLATFLLPDVSTTTKHRIVQYLFLDLASLLSDGYVRIVEELVKYPSSFSLSPSHIKLTQAFWLLDHKDFQEGLNVLLDPLVNTNDITSWQHRRIMKAFLYQGEHNRALTYAQIRQPPKVDLDDIRLHLTLLLANGLIREAFHYQRSHRIRDNTEDLLNHLFTGCEQLGKLECVIHLPLSSLEEEALVSYLQTSSSTSAQDYLLVYYLQRARYDEAAVLQENLRGGLGAAKKRLGARSALVHGYLTHLPDVAKRMSCGATRNVGPKCAIYAKPQPLSAQIRQASSSPKSNAAVINRMLDNSQDIWSSVTTPTPYTPFRNKAQRRKAYDLSETEEVANLFTPKRKNSRETSHVVFPSRVQASHSKYSEVDEGEIGLYSPAVKRRSLGDSTLLHDDVSKLMDSVLRKSIYGAPEANVSISQIISADLMSLLQTPKIMHRKKSGVRPSIESPLVDTPQSILKVRQMVQRPLSPAPISESVIPVFPRLSAKKSIGGTPEDALPSRANDSSLTPKQLRFHLPKMRVDEPVAKKQTMDEKEVEANHHSMTEDEDSEKETLDEEEPEMEADDEHKETEMEADDEHKETEMEAQNTLYETEAKEKGRERVLEKLEEITRKSTSLFPHRDIHTRKMNPLRNPDSGIPTPRQPLHGCVAKTSGTSPVLHKSFFKECVDEEEAHEEKEYFFEYAGKDSTINDTFYSFTEEEPPKVCANLDSDARIRSDDELDSNEELEGAERSKEAEESEAETDIFNEFEDSEDGAAERSKEVGDSEEDVVCEERHESSEGELQCDVEKSVEEDEEKDGEEEEEEENAKPQEDDKEVDCGKIHGNMDEEGSEISEKENTAICNEVTEKRQDGTVWHVKHSDVSNCEEMSYTSGTVEHLEKIEQDKKGTEKNIGNITQHEAENHENELNVSLNNSQIIIPLEFSDSESEPEISAAQNNSSKKVHDLKETVYDTVQAKLDTRGKEEKSISQETKSPQIEKENIIASPRKFVLENYLTKEKTEKTTYREILLRTKEPLRQEQNEDEIKKEEMTVMITDKAVTETCVVNKQIMNADSQITEDEEMITETISEDDRCISFETSEHFSPLHFSDSESEDNSSNETSSQAKDVEVHEDRIDKETVMEINIHEQHGVKANIPEEIGKELEGVVADKAVGLKEVIEGHISKQDQGKVAADLEFLPAFSNEVQGSDTSNFEISSEMGEIVTAASKHKETLNDVNEEETEAVIEDREFTQSNGSVHLDEFPQISQSEKNTSKTALELEDKDEKRHSFKNPVPLLQETDIGGNILETESEDIEMKGENQCTDLEPECTNGANELKTFDEKPYVDHNIGSNSQLLSNSSHESMELGHSAVTDQQKEPVATILENDTKITLDRNFFTNNAEETLASVSPKKTDVADSASKIERNTLLSSSSRTNNAQDTCGNESSPKISVTNLSRTDVPNMQALPAREVIPAVSTKKSSGLASSASIPLKISEEKDFTISTSTGSKLPDIIITTTTETSLKGVATESPSTPKRSLRQSDTTNKSPKTQEEVCVQASPKKFLKQSDNEDTSTIASKETDLTVLTKTSSRQYDNRDSCTKSVEGTVLAVSPKLISEHESEVTLEVEEKIALKPSLLKGTEINLPATPTKPLEKQIIETPPKAYKTSPSSKTAKGTPLRRSLRLSTSSPSTPEMMTRSGRKILQVRTPVTKSRSSSRTPRITPSKRPKEDLVDTEELQKVSQKLDLSSQNVSCSAALPALDLDVSSIPPTQHVLPLTVSPTARQNTGEIAVVTPSRPRRRSTRKSISEEILETIVEEKDKATLPTDLEIEGKGEPLKINTPLKDMPLKSTPTKATPSRTRRSTRRSSASEGLETIAEDVENSCSLKTSPKDHIAGASKTPIRRRRKSVIGDVAVDIPEKKTPRKRRQSLSGGDVSDIFRKDLHGSVEDKPETKVAPMEEHISLLGTDLTRSVTRRTRRQSRSDEEHSKLEDIRTSSPMTRTRASLLEVAQSSPDRMSTRSSGTASLTSMKDSESSEEDERLLKKRFSKRQSEGGKLLKAVNPVIEELSIGHRKSRRLTLSSTLSTTAQLQLQEHSSKPSRKSMKSLKIYSDSDETTSFLTPDPERKSHSHSSRTSRAASTSVLLIDGSNDEEELFLEVGMDTANEADDEANCCEVQESPDLPLNLIEVDKGKSKRQKSSRSVVHRGRRKTVLPRRSLHTLKIHTETSKDQEDSSELETTSTKKPRSTLRSSDTSILGLELDIKEKVEDRPGCQVTEDDGKENGITKEKEGEKVTLKDQEMPKAHEENREKEVAVIETIAELEEKQKDETVKEPTALQFEFSKPKSVASSRKVRALEYLTSEAVEFLFSPPQTAGRIVK